MSIKSVAVPIKVVFQSSAARQIKMIIFWFKVYGLDEQISGQFPC